MKKAILVFMILIFSFQYVFVQPKQQAQAVGLDTVAKLVGGKAIVRAIAERLGASLSKKQIDNVAGYIEKKTFDGDARAINFVKDSNALKASAEPTKNGFKKYLLDPMLWLTGADLVVAGIQAFQDGYDSGGVVPIWGQCAPTMQNGTVIPAGKAYVKWFNSSYKYWAMVVYDPTQMVYNWIGSSQYGAYVELKSKDGWAKSWTYYEGYSGTTDPNATWRTSYGSSGGSFSSQGGVQASSVIDSLASTSCDVQPTADDVISITNINNTVYNSFKNDTYNTNTTYVMPVDIPDTVDYNQTTLWNSIDTNLLNEVPDKDAPANVSNLLETHTRTSVTLSWVMPSDKDFSYVQIKRDNELIADSLAVTTYTDSVPDGKTVTYTIISVDSSGNRSVGVSIKVDTSDIEPIDVKPDSGSWWEWLLKPLIEAIKGIGDLLAGLFIPSDGAFDGLFTDIFDKFNAKLPMITDLGNFFGGVKDTVVDSNAKPPDFKVTMPEAWGGGTFSVIDFKYFTDYRDWVLNFIRFTSWWVFLRRLYNRIPRMIY